MSDFDILSSDIRLYDIFGDKSNISVIQLWVVKIEEDGQSEFRYIYGRVLPSTYSSDRWISKDKEKATLYGNCSVKMYALTASSTSEKLQIFFQKFIYGSSLQEASLSSGISLDGKLADGIGTVSFGIQPPIVRPVMHLPTRDYFQCKTKRLSPINDVSVDSGAVSSAKKQSIFTVSQGHDHIFAQAVCRTLDTDTGMDFSNLDAWRLGDLEFICVPGLTISEKRKFRVALQGEQSLIELFEPLTREPADLLMVLNSYNDDCIQGSYVMQFDKSAAYPLSHLFAIDTFKNQIATVFTLEIYALSNAGDGVRLCLQTGQHFFSGASINIKAVAGVTSNNRMDWLEKQVPHRDIHKLAGATHVARGAYSVRSEIGGHTDDAWVEQNQLTETQVCNLLPKPSEGRFFPTLSESNKSREEMVSWLRLIFEKHRDAQIAWIDPFMEDVGIDLMHQMGSNTGNYLIITTEKKSNEDELTPTQTTRIDRLLAQCTGWGNGYFGNIQLRVLSVPEGKLHDRMILVRDSDGKPMAGYHLSNSIQRASENFPLLTTPIPPDILTNIFKYIDSIIQNTLHNATESTPSATLIFDSKSYRQKLKKQPIQNKEEKFFIYKSGSGDILAWWLNDPALAGLFGENLLKIIETKGLSEDNDLDYENIPLMPNKFWSGDFPMQEFSSAWDAFSDIAAHSHTVDFFRHNHPPLPQSITDGLLAHLNPSRPNALPAKIGNSHLDIENYLSRTLRELLLSNENPIHIFRSNSPLTSWSDYFAIKLLWSESPEEMMGWLDQICSHPIEQKARTLSLVIQAFHFIFESLEIVKDQRQIEATLKSRIYFTQWIGIHALNDLIKRENSDPDTILKINHIESHSDRQMALCWIIKEAVKVQHTETPKLISRLIKTIEKPLTELEIKDLLKNIRQNLSALYNDTPWTLEGLMAPLLKIRMVNINQLSHVWLAELKEQLEAGLTSQSISFSKIGTGAFTDEMAILFKHLDSDEQKNIISKITKISNQLARKIRTPFSKQVNYTECTRAHEINFWIYALFLRIKTLTPNTQSEQLEKTLDQSKALTDRLSVEDINSLNQEILGYFNSDLNQIENHRISYALGAAIKSD